MDNTFQGEKTMAEGISLEILTNSDQIPPIPTNGMKLLEMIQKPGDKIDISTFAQLVEVDPGLLAKILQIANSPYYREVDEIISLRSAITRIGLRDTINTVSLFFFQKLLPDFPDIEGFLYQDYWAYSWACATANRFLGHPKLQMDVLPGELYIAGLLHGMGKLLMAIHYPHEFTECLQRAEKFNEPLYKAELSVFETTDSLIASKIMSAWYLPENIANAVAFYHKPEAAPAEYRDIAGLTQLAYCLAGMSGIGKNGDGILMDISDTYICKRSDLIISKQPFREKIVREILKTL